MKKLIILTASVLLFTSCDKVDGQLEVLKEVTLKSKRDEVTLSEGKGQAELKFRTKRNLTLKTQGKELKIKLNKGTEFPEDGNFSFPIDSLGEDFMVEGYVDTNISYGDIISTTETCYESRPYRRCYRDGCRVVYRSVRGVRNVDYRMNIKTQTSNVEFVENGEVVAIFSSDNTKSVRDVVNYGFCSTPGWYPGRPYPIYRRRRSW